MPPTRPWNRVILVLRAMPSTSTMIEECAVVSEVDGANTKISFGGLSKPPFGDCATYSESTFSGTWPSERAIGH